VGDVVPAGCYSTHVADDPHTPRPPRARPVAELQCEALLGRVEELSRRWAIAMILERPLEDIGELPLEELAREAPLVCAQALRALQSDVELARLTGRGGGGREQSAAARRLAAVCGAREPAALVDAVEALRGVLWEALLAQLAEASARLLADVGDRLACVCSSMLSVAVAAAAPAAPVAVPRARVAEVEAAADSPAARPHLARRDSRPPGEAVIVDEHASSGHAPSLLAMSPSDSSPRFGAPGPEIEIRDERHEEGPASWIRSIGAQLERFERDGVPFAVLLVELVDIERMRREESPDELSRLAECLEHELAAALVSVPGSITRERPGRCWLLAPQHERDGAERLAQRLMRELYARGDDRARPLVVAIGTAVCPEDGREPAALAAHADVGLYAARSAVRAALARAAVAPVDESA
jgi:hypothetical protein